MQVLRQCFALSLVSLLPLQAWNATGHRVVAAIAYDHLNPKAKARVDELLKQHPDLAKLPSREAFLDASVWPDTIKGDARFYDDTKKDAVPTPLLFGFPTMARHTNWHYIDIPFSPDGTPLEPPAVPNALVELNRILKGPSLSSYYLPWLVHLVGDVHQPLHCVSRFTKSEPHGDQGGNLTFVMPGRNLHAVWDNGAGNDSSEAYVDQFAAEITTEFAGSTGQSPKLSKESKKWIDEGVELAKRDVYTFGDEPSSRERPIALPNGYESHVRTIARVQLAKAGFRLASALNAKLGR